MQNPSDSEITFKVARELASKNCSTLSSEYLEADHCWIFFSLSHGDWATAVSRHGQVSSVYDLRDDPLKMQEYLSMFSAYCSGDRQVADGLLRDFMGKHYRDGA